MYIIMLHENIHAARVITLSAEELGTTSKNSLSGITLSLGQRYILQIVERNMLRKFGHHVAMCCDMLGVVGSSLKLVKFEPTTPNMSQHVATGWSNARNMLRSTMLQYVALACCDRLAEALN